MKQFIKKYPKRLIFAALIILLIAIVGTVNNYRTYQTAKVPEKIVYPKTYIDETIVEFMEEIYGADEIRREFDYFGNEKLYYRRNGKSLESGKAGSNINEKMFEMRIDNDSYAPEDTITVTLNNKLLNDVSFYSEKYLLQIWEGHDRWFDVHSGTLDFEERVELICLRTGESYELKIPLNSVREVSDDPITLIPGNYRLSIPFFVLNNPEYIDEEDRRLTCEFVIK